VNGAPGLADAVLAVFRRVHETVFAGDRAANPALEVAVSEVLVAGDTPTVVLLTPWTLNGLAFPPDDQLPEICEIGGVSRRLFHNNLEGLGDYWSVNLVPDVSKITGQDVALSVARGLAEPWRDVVVQLRGEVGQANPGRRRLLDVRPSGPMPGASRGSGNGAAAWN
jgi:hypothetical protein